MYSNIVQNLNCFRVLIWKFTNGQSLGSNKMVHLIPFASKHKKFWFYESKCFSTIHGERNTENKIVVDKAQKIVRPSIDPRGTTIMMFPGQGSQFVGMVTEDLLMTPNVPEMFEVASSILKYNLLDLCLHGPKEELDKTALCQAAVLVTSLAVVEKLKNEEPEAIENCVGALGFSVGEYTALIFAGALTFEDGVRLIKIRGQAMQAASELVPSGMMTVMYGADSKIKFCCYAAREWCKKHEDIEDPVCETANYLFPHCKVVAGNEEALNFIELNAKEFGIRKTKRLPVSGAFHTNLMKPAEYVLVNALSSTSFIKPEIRVYSNVDGLPYGNNAEEIRKKLKLQLCRPVKWEQTVHSVYNRSVDTSFPKTYECGPGRSLLTILKYINQKASQSGVACLHK